MTIRTLNICYIIYQYDYADLLTEIFIFLSIIKKPLITYRKL